MTLQEQVATLEAKLAEAEAKLAAVHKVSRRLRGNGHLVWSGRLDAASNSRLKGGDG